MLATEKLFVAAIMFFRANTDEFESLPVSSRSLLLVDSSKFGKLQAPDSYEFVLCLFPIIKQLTNN